MKDNKFIVVRVDYSIYSYEYVLQEKQNGRIWAKGMEKDKLDYICNLLNQDDMFQKQLKQNIK